MFHDGWLTFLTELVLFSCFFFSSHHISYTAALSDASGRGEEPGCYDIPAWEGLRLNCGSEVLIGKPKSPRRSGAAVN